MSGVQSQLRGGARRPTPTRACSVHGPVVEISTSLRTLRRRTRRLSATSSVYSRGAHGPPTGRRVFKRTSSGTARLERSGVPFWVALGAPPSAGILDFYILCVYLAYTRADRPLQVLSAAGMCVVPPVDGYIFKRAGRLKTNPPGLCGFLGSPSLPPRVRSVRCVCGMDFFTSRVWSADTHTDVSNRNRWAILLIRVYT